LGLTLGLWLGGCKSSPPQSVISPNASPTVSPNNEAAQPSASSPPNASATIYTAAADCVTFVPQKVEVSKDNAMTDAVGKVLAAQPAIATIITDYTVQKNSDVATIDFKLDPKAQQSISALSLCEQFALFGSLRETLVQTPDWGIKTVRFTEGGTELGL